MNNETSTKDFLPVPALPDSGPVPCGATGPALHWPQDRPVSLYLVSRAEDAASSCHFWIGLTRPGPLSPGELLDLPDAPAILTAAARQGVKEPGPLMLSDTRSQPARHVYLLPVPPTAPAGFALWLRDLATTLASWTPASIGLYVSPGLLPGVPARSHELVSSILRQVIATSATRDFYLLTGEHGLNPILNTALRLKGEIESAALAVRVFH